MLELVRIVAVIVGTGIGCWYDIFNRKNVPDLFLYAFLGLSLLINVFDYSVFIAKLPIAVLLVAFLYVLYKFGQIGAADVIVLAAIYAALPSIENPLLSKPPISEAILPFQLPSILSILAIAAFLFALYIILHYLPIIAGKLKKREIKLSLPNLAQCLILIIAYGFVVFTIASSPAIMFVGSTYLLLIGFVLFLLCFFILFKDTITDSMIRWKTKVEEEDVIALEKIDEKTIKKLKLGRLVTAEQLKRMKKLKRKWPVLDLPIFLPFIFVSLIIYVCIGNVLLYPL